jgi:antitoxin CcdA
MRMSNAHSVVPSRRPVNVSVNAALVAEARRLGINLSATLERALAVEIRQRLRDQWRAVHEPAIAAYNAQVEREGVFSDGLRTF